MTYPNTRYTDPEEQNHKSPGQLAYEADCAARPEYHTGERRRTWYELSDLIRDTWEREPTSRWGGQ